MGSIKISIVYGVHSYRALKYAGKPWIRQKIFANVSKPLFRQTFLPPNFFTIRYSVDDVWLIL